MAPPPRWSAWRVVVGFGVVSLTIDLVADGAAALAGPLLGQLGATAVVVGLVTGTAEALGFMLRLYSGPAVDRSQRYWGFAIAGYLITAVSVPLLATTPFLGSAGLAVAAALIIIERAGKAIRSPAKTVLLSYPASAVGRGNGFAVHKVFDQVGSLSGPLVVAAIIAVTGVLWPAFAALGFPAIVAVVVLFWLRHRVPDPRSYEPEAFVSNPTKSDPGTIHAYSTKPTSNRLSGTFLLFSVASGLNTLGLVGFGIISYHLTATSLVSLPVIPVLFAAGMLAAAVAALGTGWIYDRIGGSVLVIVPVLTAGVPILGLSSALPAVVVGVVLWGAATGIQDSTVKALVADLVPVRRRGTAYGIFATFQGVGAFVGAALAGWLYPNSVALSLITVPAQGVACALLSVVALRARRAKASLRGHTTSA
jgi:sugar phosphate permease